MLENQIKEELSIHLFSAIAARAGYQVSYPRIDSGDDLIIDRMEKLPNRNNYSSGGKALAFQLKTTTEKQISTNSNAIAYDLSAKNYDDLIFRRNLLMEDMFRVVPSVLILLVLPDSTEKWLQVLPNEKVCTLNGVFYWFYPTEQHGFSTNEYKHRISIPQIN